MMLLHFLRWLHANSDAHVEMLLLRGGPLEPRFRELGPVRVLRPLDGSSLFHRIETGLEYLGLLRVAGRIRGARYRLLLRKARGMDVVYLNSVASFSLALYLPRGPRVICHVHELEMGLRLGTPRSLAWPDLVDRVDVFIAASQAVADNLVENRGVPAERIRTHHEFIDVARFSSDETTEMALPVPAGAPVVGGCGTMEWRKGADLFAQVAAVVGRTRPDIHFVWIGATPTRDLWPVEHEIRSIGIGDRVHLLPETEDPASFFRAVDVFALTSREDPFPLVALEASAVGTPVVSFDNGGMREFLTPESGRLVPYLDVAAMAAAIVDLVDHPEAREAVGRAARESVARYDVSRGAPALWSDVRDGVLRADAQPGRPERNWWDSKVSGLLLAAYATVAVGPAEPHEVLGPLALLVVSAALLGLYAHIVDDSFDVPSDLAAGKPNAVVALSLRARVLVALALAVGGLAPWLGLWPGSIGVAVLAVIIVLPIIYAAPPIRLKQRGAVGLVSDAVMSHVAPTAFAIALMTERSDVGARSVAAVAAALLVWSLARGVRSILVHQMRDERNDRAGGLRTFVVQQGSERAALLARRFAFPAEVLSLGTLAVLAGVRSLLIPVFTVVYALTWVVARRFWPLPFAPAPTQHRARMALERFTIVWPPLLVGAWLASSDAAFLVLLIAPVVLFHRTVLREARAIGSRFIPFLWRVFASGRALVTSSGS